ncbi:putative uncharacterized protein FLJ44672 [Pongo abelii]|uniref:putative uncharacterized protein FLJ44672 n=1 Tax=Pongo abelii TaxID=9601 RepID=UPI003004A83E
MQPGGTAGPAEAAMQEAEAGPAEAAMREAEAGPPQVSLSRPTCGLLASSPGPVLPPGCVSRPDSGLPTTSLDSAPAQLPAALVGPQLPEAKLPRPSSGLTVASPGSAPALQWCLQAPNGLRSVGSSRPSLGLPAASAGPNRPEVGLSRPSSGLLGPLQAQRVLDEGPSGVSSCLPSASRGPASTSQWALQAHLLPGTVASSGRGGLRRPSFCLPEAKLDVTAAFHGLAFAPLHPLQALDFLQSASPGPALPPGSLCRPRLPLSRSLQGQLRPPGGLCRPKSSSSWPGSGPGRATSQPPRAQLRPLGGLSRCKTSSSQPLQAQLLLPPSGLFRPSPAHGSRRPSQALLLTFGGLFRPRT